MKMVELNGYSNNNATQSGTIGGLGANLSNKSYIKQVKKKYIATYDDASSVTTCNDYLWLLASSEIVNSGYQSGAYGVAITSEGSQYMYYQKNATEAYNVASENRVKKTSSSDSVLWWWLRSPRCDYDESFCGVNSDGYVSISNGASGSGGVAPGFSI